MKRTGLIVAAILALTACQENNGYTIKGTAEAADGEYVYLLNTDARATILDSAVIRNGRFQFEGQAQTDASPKTLMHVSENSRMGTLLFLESGEISAHLTKNNSEARGTKNNEALCQFLNEYQKMETEKQQLYRQIYTSSASEAELEEMWAEFDRKDAAQQNYIFEQMEANIDQPFGIYLLTSFGMRYDAEKLNDLLPRIPAELTSNKAIAQLKRYVENRMNTALGRQFIDLSMKTPEGKDVRLSDYIGKEKYVLLYYWASWCNPCRNEMPEVVEFYQTYKSRGFGMVGISLDHDIEEWKTAIEEMELSWPQLSNLKAWNSESAVRYGILGIPATILIDREGRIIARDLRGEELILKLKELFK